MNFKISSFVVTLNFVLYACLSSGMDSNDKYWSHVFEQGTVIAYQENNSQKFLDISGLRVDLSSDKMSIGGIGRCASSASQLMSRGLNALGNRNKVFNLPFSIEALKLSSAIKAFDYKTFIAKNISIENN